MSTQQSSLPSIPLPPSPAFLATENVPLHPELSAFSQTIPLIQSAIREIRHARTAIHLLSLTENFSALQNLFTSAQHSALPLDLLPQPLRSNYHAHLRTLAFEFHRARYLLLQERTRLLSQLTSSQ
jgi:hypothetical protein